MLVNLLDNAIKFTKQGVIQISAQVTASDGSDPLLQLEVSDTGMGMSAAEMEGLFHPFYQIRSTPRDSPHGTGLGLAICQRLAHQLGGEVTVRSLPMSGSTFALTVPVSLPAQEVVPDARGFRGGGSFQARKWSRLPGCTPVSCWPKITTPTERSSGSASARRAPRSSPRGTAAKHSTEFARQTREGRPIEAVIMDMEMPVLDGYEAVRQLRATDFKAPIIAVTAYAMSKDRDECLSLGCDDHISKPIDWNMFFRKLAKLLGAARIHLRPSNSARSAGLRPHAVEELLDRRNADVNTVSLLDRSPGPRAKFGEAGGVVQDRKRCSGQAVDVEERLDQPVDTWLNDFAHGRDVGGKHGNAAGHCVEQRPRHHKRRRQIDVQVAQPQHVGKLLGENAAQEEKPGKIELTAAQHPLLEAR